MSVAELRELLGRAAEVYKRALIGHQPGLTWDYLVLTAANEHQAAGYRHELKTRSEGSGPLGAFFPTSQQTIVVPDPPGFRAGSGGATFGVLRAIAAHQKSVGDKKPFEALRILLIHSGGASQRLPQFSSLGKIFTPLPLIRPDGQLMTLFDQLYLMLAGLPARVGPGMLVAAGDVFLMFDGSAVPPPPAGVSALSIRVPAAMAEAHGIFLADAARNAGGFSPIVGTMQKAAVAQMKAASATDRAGRVLIDSGLLWFDSAATTALYKLSTKYSASWHLNTRRQIDLYADIVPAAISGSAGPHPGDALMMKLDADLRKALRNSPLWAYELPSAHFQHLGTTRQFRDAMVGLDKSPAAEVFAQNVRFAGIRAVPTGARIYQSIIESAAVDLAEFVVIENCHLAGRMAIGRGSVLSGIEYSAPVGAKSVVVPPETLVFGVPIVDGAESGVVNVVCGIDDDFKGDKTLCNIPIRRWLHYAGLTQEDLWDGAERTLWHAKLFALDAPLGELMWMANPIKLADDRRKAWRKSRRYSMAEILELADAGAMAAHRDTISGMLQAAEWIGAVKSQAVSSVQSSVNHFGSRGYACMGERIFSAALDEKNPPLIRARLAWSLGEIQSRPHFPKDVKFPAPISTLQKLAFNCISEAMTPPPGAASRTTRIISKEQFAAFAPVRLDFAGGWTDTPPYCLENGGAVVNVAVNLNDAEPIQSTFHPLAEPVVRLVSRDLGKTKVITDPAQLRGVIEPGDPFALQIIALRLAGLAPAPGETSQRKWLARIGRPGEKSPGGFEIITAANLPKGSGMGTSSILGATTIAVLRAASGQDISPATLFEQTSLLEQHLGTGGGWQDQVGGIGGGAKITLTKPGIPQVLHVRPIPLSPAQSRALEERIVVYFTGQQRLARNILREVMGRYLSREPAMMVLFNELKQSALACEAAIRKSDWLSCATEINRYWRIKKDLFPGSTTPAIDALFLELRPFYLGAGLAGAGGGGFAYFLCGDADQAHRLRTELRKISTRPGNLGLPFAASINRTGIRVSSQSRVYAA
jgi:fucokinase